MKVDKQDKKSFDIGFRSKSLLKRIGKEFLICLGFLIILGVIASYASKHENQKVDDNLSKQELKMLNESNFSKNN
jgi:hypothetical protein